MNSLGSCQILQELHQQHKLQLAGLHSIVMMRGAQLFPCLGNPTWTRFSFFAFLSWLFYSVISAGCPTTILTSVNPLFLKRFRRDRIIGPYAERDLSIERPDLDDDKTMMKLHKDQKRRAEKENRDRRTNDQDYKEPDNENNEDLSMQRHTDKKKSARKVEAFGGPHEDKDALKSECMVTIV